MPTKVAEYELYKRIKLLGEGSFGKAYLVECLQDKSTWVIKYMDLNAMTSQEKEETLREAKILEILKHPNIVKFKEVYKTKKGKLCIVMEYADGGDLTKRIKEQKGQYFSESQILDWFTQICLAIKHVHDRKIIHRDLKCQNIFVTKDNTIKLGDFGIARVLKRTLEKAKTMVGTPYYISPEIIQSQQYTLQTDIWSLGVILYELCSLRPPFDGRSLQDLALKIVKGQYQPIPSKYSKDLKNLIEEDPLSKKFQVKINSIIILKETPVVVNRIRGFLSETVRAQEFSHTILHKQVFEPKGNLQNVNLVNKEEPCPKNLLDDQIKKFSNELPSIPQQQPQQFQPQSKPSASPISQQQSKQSQFSAAPSQQKQYNSAGDQMNKPKDQNLMKPPMLGGGQPQQQQQQPDKRPLPQFGYKPSEQNEVNRNQSREKLERNPSKDRMLDQKRQPEPASKPRPPSAKQYQKPSSQQHQRPQSSRPAAQQDVKSVQNQAQKRVVVNKQRPQSDSRFNEEKQRQEERIKILKQREQEQKEKRLQEQKEKLEKQEQEKQERALRLQKQRDEVEAKMKILEEKENKLRKEKQQREEDQRLKQEQLKQKEEMKRQEEQQKKYMQQQQQQERKQWEQQQQQQVQKKSKEDGFEKKKQQEGQVMLGKMQEANKEFDQMLLELNDILENVNKNVEKLPQQDQKNYFDYETMMIQKNALIEDRDDDSDDPEDEKKKNEAENLKQRKKDEKQLKPQKSEEDDFCLFQDQGKIEVDI